MNLYQDVFFRAMDTLRGRRTIERLHFLRRSQHWTPHELAQWQLDRLNDLLAQAKANSPYYAKALAHIALPLKALSDIEQLPVLDKPIIRANFEGLQCTNLPRSRFVQNRTGGSTGEPTIYFWDKRGMDWNRGSVYRSAEWAGTALGERTAQMSGSIHDRTESQKLQNRIVYFLQRYRDFPVGTLTDEILETYFQEICAYKPTAIWGYASGANAFAEYIEREHPGADLRFLKAIITSSETLRDDQRERINRVFGSTVVHDNYGSREMYIGAECSQHDGYHLHADVLYVEVVDEHNRACKPGERGRILLTDLSNHAFPFIRYEIGDVGIMAEPKPCPCGVTLPKLAKVEGRIADLITLSDRVLTAPNLTLQFINLGGVNGFQVRQDAPNRLDLYIVPGEGYGPAVRAYALNALRLIAGPTVNVALHEVDDIAVPESGKRRFVISTVTPAQVRAYALEQQQAGSA